MNRISLWLGAGLVHSHSFTAAARLLPYLVLAALVFAVYAPALRLPPTNPDDLRYLTSVAATGNPLSYFARDDGVGNNLYRPFMSISLWLAYRLFGAWALPNHAINLGLHFAAAALLFRLARRFKAGTLPAFLVALLFLISPNTANAAEEVFDRPMAAVGIWLLLLIEHLRPSLTAGEGAPPSAVRLPYVVSLCMLAVLTKESGLVLPIFVAAFALALGPGANLSPRTRAWLVAAPVAVILVYFLIRVIVFGANATAYDQEGYLLLASRRYAGLSELPAGLKLLAMAENAAKHLLTPVLPVFHRYGQILGGPLLSESAALIASTAALFGLASLGRPNRLQWAAVLLVMVSAVVHATLYRSRLQYLSQIAFCLYVGASPYLMGRPGSVRWAALRNTLGLALAAVMVLNGLSLIDRNLSESLMVRTRRLDRYAAGVHAIPDNVDSRMVGEVLEIYR